MVTSLAKTKELKTIVTLDRHIPVDRLTECIQNGFVYTMKDNKGNILGILRYSLFWQTIPFLDLIFLKESVRGQGSGKAMMTFWENEMKQLGFSSVMTSTQADETAYRFYEALGYKKCGAFFPPCQEAEEWIYKKEI